MDERRDRHWIYAGTEGMKIAWFIFWLMATLGQGLQAIADSANLREDYKPAHSLTSSPKLLLHAVLKSDLVATQKAIDELYEESTIPRGVDIVLWASDVEILKLLLSRGASIDVRDSSGLNALMVCAQGGHLKMAEYLLEKGFSVNDKDYYGRSPLHYGAGNSSPAMVKMLISKGAYVDNQTSEGETALMAAIKGGNIEVVRALLDANAALLLRNGKEKTALDILAVDDESDAITDEEWRLKRELVRKAMEKRRGM